MPNPDIRPAVIRCPHSVKCFSKQGTDEILCKAWDAVKTEVLRQGFCPAATCVTANVGESQVFEIAAEPKVSPVLLADAVPVDAKSAGCPMVPASVHLEVTGDENG